MQGQARSRFAGFTLLELLVAISVFAVLALMVYGSLSTVLGIRKQTDASANRLAKAQQAFLILERDLEQTVGRSVRDELGGSLAAFSASDVTGYQTLEFVKGGYQNPRPDIFHRSTLQRIAYKLDDDKRLMRIIWPVLDRPSVIEAREYPLLEGVEEMSMRFLDTSDEWQPNWPPPNLNNNNASQLLLPRAVEFVLTLKDMGSIKRIFVIAGGG